MIEVASWISKKPDRCGGDACVRDSRIPVWQLVEARRLGSTPARLLEDHPGLTPGDLEAAWEYHRLNRLEVERNIWENQAVMETRGGDHRLALIVRGWQLGLSEAHIAECFAPPLSRTELLDAKTAYLARKPTFDASLPGWLPMELRGGLDGDGPVVC